MLARNVIVVASAMCRLGEHGCPFHVGRAMKKLVWIVMLGLLWIYGAGYFSLSERGAMRYLDSWERHSLDGDAAGICELMHDDLTFSIDDRSTPGHPIDMSGGKAELCDYYSQVVPAMKHIVSGMQVTREDVDVKRDWLHPWTVEVSYTEQRSVSMTAVQMQVNTVGEDKLTLVKTLTGGVKIKSLRAKTRMAQTSS